MELVTRAALLCVTGAALALVVRQGSQVMGLARPAAELFDFFRELGDKSGLSPALLAPLYKTAGIALVVRTGGALCRDAGETALAGVVEGAGTLCALLTALPLLREVMDMLLKLMA